ncbi:MAG: hypothetical protein ACOCP4_05700 [Candidatus Woesearchaeota archaeon]
MLNKINMIINTKNSTLGNKLTNKGLNIMIQKELIKPLITLKLLIFLKRSLVKIKVPANNKENEKKTI